MPLLQGPGTFPQPAFSNLNTEQCVYFKQLGNIFLKAYCNKTLHYTHASPLGEEDERQNTPRAISHFMRYTAWKGLKYDGDEGGKKTFIARMEQKDSLKW